MSVVLRLMMLSDEVDDFRREYEVPVGMDLLELHEFICGDLEYDTSNFCSFFTSNEKWEKGQEYTLFDMKASEEGIVALPMEGATLGQVIPGSRARLIFMFDIFAGRSMFIELVEAGEAEDAVRYPRIAKSEGDPPHQLDAESILTEESPFDEIMEEFAAFDCDDDYPDDY